MWSPKSGRGRTNGAYHQPSFSAKSALSGEEHLAWEQLISVLSLSVPSISQCSFACLDAETVLVSFLGGSSKRKG